MEGDTDLIRAARDGRIAIVRQLIANGVGLNAANQEGFNALMYAALNGHSRVVSLLIEAGADLYARNVAGRSVLDLTSKAVIVLQLKSAEELTRLENAARTGNVEYIYHFIAQGGNINIVVRNGMNMLMIASLNNIIEVVDILLLNGANINAQDANGNTALILAASESCAFVVGQLIRAQAELNIANEDGNTALMTSISEGRKIITLSLVKAHAKLDIANKNGMTALMIAAQEGREYEAKLLVDYGAEIAIRSNDGMTAFDYARSEGYPDIADRLTVNDEYVSISILARSITRALDAISNNAAQDPEPVEEISSSTDDNGEHDDIGIEIENEAPESRAILLESLLLGFIKPENKLMQEFLDAMLYLQKIENEKIAYVKNFEHNEHAPVIDNITSSNISFLYTDYEHRAIIY